ncbi:MAG: serine hydrolase, partial [Sandarakinorhabdus sp.]|nr:serine hydrolase [Sandarakinorhabdus sp.]
MRKMTIAIGACAAALLAGGLWFASLDPETRGILGHLPTNADVLGWSVDQRDAAFR